MSYDSWKMTEPYSPYDEDPPEEEEPEMKITWDEKGRRLVDGVLAPEEGDLYRDAVTVGVEHFKLHNGYEPTPMVMGPNGLGYWIARHAARKATDALLLKARELGVSEGQWEALRVVAAEVAYD